MAKIINRIDQIKIEIFDIIRQQEALQNQFSILQQKKMELSNEFKKLESEAHDK